MNYLQILDDFKKDYEKDKKFFERKIKPLSRLVITIGIIGIIVTYFSPFISGIFFFLLLFPISYLRTKIIETNKRRKKWLKKLNFTDTTIKLNKEVSSKLNKTMLWAMIFGLALILALAIFLFFIKGPDGMFIELGKVMGGVAQEIPNPLLLLSYFTAFIVGFITLGLANNLHNEYYKFGKETKTIIKDIERHKKELKNAGLT